MLTLSLCRSTQDADAAPASKKAKTTASSASSLRAHLETLLTRFSRSAADDPAELVKSWRHKLQKVRLTAVSSRCVLLTRLVSFRSSSERPTLRLPCVPFLCRCARAQLTCLVANTGDGALRRVL